MLFVEQKSKLLSIQGNSWKLHIKLVLTFKEHLMWLFHVYGCKSYNATMRQYPTGIYLFKVNKETQNTKSVQS